MGQKLSNRLLIGGCVFVLTTLATTPALAQPARPYLALWDDFREGFTADMPGARWFHFSAGTYASDDGVASTSRHGGLRVISSGTNPATGEPAFVRTIGQEHANGGLPGQLDHFKWLVYMNHWASSGYPGFDAVPGYELSCASWMGGRTFGTQAHPFGANIVDPQDDLRLALVAHDTFDFETNMVFDFYVTNERIYAVYARLPFARTPTHNYAAFTFMVPVGTTRPGEIHSLRTAYDRAAGVVRWLLDGYEVYRVDQIGRRVSRVFMTLDNGGIEEIVAPRQLDCGMGMFSLLDAYRPSEIGLVELSDSLLYFEPDVGPPLPQTFLDATSLQANRIFGQGAEIDVRRYVVSNRWVEHRGRGFCLDDDEDDRDRDDRDRN
jgi:hypothetical protein